MFKPITKSPPLSDGGLRKDVPLLRSGNKLDGRPGAEHTLAEGRWWKSFLALARGCRDAGGFVRFSAGALSRAGFRSREVISHHTNSGFLSLNTMKSNRIKIVLENWHMSIQGVEKYDIIFSLW